jgi:tetratricopeptide (TPR) repeat protein
MAAEVGETGTDVTQKRNGLASAGPSPNAYNGRMKRLLPLVVFALAALGVRAELPFIENDYVKAQAQARAKNLPLFVEAWAPWCHTCRSMKANVYTDKSLERYAPRFVWLSLNTEAPESAAFLKQYPIPALPTVLVLGAHDVALRYVGGANVAQMRSMLDDAEATYRSRSEAEADKILVEGDRLAADGQHDAAAKSYDTALRNAPRRWPRYGRTAESLVFALSMGKDQERCATRALALYPRVKGTVSAANVAAVGLSCATSIDKASEKRVGLIQSLEKATREVFDDPKMTPKLSGDDRSGLYMALIDARDSAGDEEGVLVLQTQWAAFLEEAAAQAKTAEQRAVYDSHRLSAYLDLGTPEKALPMLEQSARDFPNDYNPPARMAYAYNALHDFDKALEMSDRALAMVYGPRKLAVLSVRADIYTAKGDPKAARETIVQAIEYAKSLPEGQRSPTRIAGLEKRLASMQ